MKVLIITKDKTIFDSKSRAHQEVLKSSRLVEQLHVIVLTNKTDTCEFQKVSEQLFLYPTQSKNRLFFIFDALSIVKYQMTLKFHLIVDLISAEDPFICALVSYFISWKYGKNFMIGVYQDFFLDNDETHIIRNALKTDVMDYLFVRASGIRVPSETIGEMLYQRKPELVKRIYILPFVTEDNKRRDPESIVDIHKRYPKFNIILIFGSKLIKPLAFGRAKAVIKDLRKRYPKIGLVVIGKVRFKIWQWLMLRISPAPIVFENSYHNVLSDYRTANVFIDTSNVNEPGGPLTDAALAGCPVVASETEASLDIIHDGQNGFISNPRDIKLFSRKIMDVLEKVGLREQMKLFYHNIAEVYGNDVEDYHERLIGIWDKCKSVVEGKIHIPAPANTTPSTTFASFTLDKVKFVEKKLQKKAYTLSKDGELDYIFNVDQVKVGIQEALAEFDKSDVGKKEEDGDENI